MTTTTTTTMQQIWGALARAGAAHGDTRELRALARIVDPSEAGSGAVLLGGAYVGYADGQCQWIAPATDYVAAVAAMCARPSLPAPEDAYAALLSQLDPEWCSVDADLSDLCGYPEAVRRWARDY